MKPLTLCMNPAVRYTTQSSAYDRLLVGRPLTDRRISYYQRLRAAEQLGVPPSAVRSILKKKERAARMLEMQRRFE